MPGPSLTLRVAEIEAARNCPMKYPPLLTAIIVLTTYCAASAQQPPAVAPQKIDTSRGDKMLAEYFASETAKLRDNCLAEIKTLDDWKARRDEYRRQLRE